MRGISFSSESVLEEWVEAYWEETSLEHYRGRLRFGEKWGVPYGPNACDETAKVFRQLQIPNGNEDHSGPAPADIVIASPIVDEDCKVVRWSVLVVELKNRTLEPKDVGQLARYMQGVRDCPELDRLGEFAVYGALLGTGMSWPCSDVLSMCEGIVGLVVEIDGSQIILERYDDRFQHSQPEPAFEVIEGEGAA